jgi:glycosyltransferase involved in cell wall biosynthesis
MKILFNNELFESDFYCGINKYYGILFNNLSKLETVLQPCYIRNPFINQNNFPESVFYLNKAFYRHGKKDKFLTFLKKSLPFSSKLFNFLLKKNRDIFLQRLLKNDFDILHLDFCWSPNKEMIDVISKYVTKPIILVVHDIGLYAIPTDPYYSKKFFAPPEAKELLKIATKIIAISKTTKRDLIKFFSVAENKIEIVYNCYNKFESLPCEGAELPKKYILYVGQRFHRKNFHFFVNSIREILLNDPEIKLVFTMQPLTDEEKSYIACLGILDSFVFVKAGNERNLAYLYENALCCAVPTLYEGFGMIILEAMTYGCPVLTSDVDSAMREVGGDAARYFDPLDQRSICEVTKEVLYNEELRKKMAQDGLEQAKKFTSQNMIKRVIEIYSQSL